jgi:hypothetical protein
MQRTFVCLDWLAVIDAHFRLHPTQKWKKMSARKRGNKNISYIV